MNLSDVQHLTILFELDQQAHSATLIKYGNKQHVLPEYEKHTLLASVLGHHISMLLLDLSDPIWQLSRAKQEAVVWYILNHTLSTLTYDLGIALITEQKDSALATMNEMIRIETGI